MNPIEYFVDSFSNLQRKLFLIFFFYSMINICTVKINIQHIDTLNITYKYDFSSISTKLCAIQVVVILNLLPLFQSQVSVFIMASGGTFTAPAKKRICVYLKDKNRFFVVHLCLYFKQMT